MAPAATVSKGNFVDNLLGLVSRPALTPQQIGVVPTTAHPLDPLTAAEVSAAGKACRLHAESLGLKNLRFNAISLEVGQCAIL
jgi:Cu2+-containing amine oxidase